MLSLSSAPQKLAVVLCLGVALVANLAPPAVATTPTAAGSATDHVVTTAARTSLVGRAAAAPTVASAVPLDSAVPAPGFTASAPAPTPAAATVADTDPTSGSTSLGYGCADALAYLAAHAAPGFSFECPGYALGHEAMTCVNVPGVCPGGKLIAINDPCAAAYENEASNSWVLTGQSDAPIDPNGSC